MTRLWRVGVRACVQATCKRSLEQVALKVYHMENLCELNHYQVYREIRVHSALSHQHIIQLYCAFQVRRLARARKHLPEQPSAGRGVTKTAALLCKTDGHAPHVLRVLRRRATTW